ncbi:MAG: phosphotransferase [Francisellaceae bacterium]|jgi:streptomycin 6-kinase|nr:phosphotransferase [Francisellaceae bacterium]MBT6206818.1 phosphotransferase [Francisellaceae bacterium]MBT6538809.1 phosphotransferase [Francisellaceae bacterium]
MLANKFQIKIVNLFGSKGKKWINDLPNTILQLESIWNLKILAPFQELSCNFVAPTNAHSIVKIGVDTDEVSSEVKALEKYNGQGCCKLLSNNTQYNAMLLEQLEPKLLSNFESSDPEFTTKTCCDVIRDLYQPTDSSNIEFKNISSWLERLEIVSNNSCISNRLIDKASSIKNDLLKSTSEMVILHADLHHNNIMQDLSGNWRAIDPKGMIGDPVYEIGAFMRNPIPEIFTDNHLKQKLYNRVSIFNEFLGYDTDRILAWSFVQTVLSALWFSDINNDDSQGMSHIATQLNSMYH